MYHVCRCGIGFAGPAEQKLCGKCKRRHSSNWLHVLTEDERIERRNARRMNRDSMIRRQLSDAELARRFHCSGFDMTIITAAMERHTAQRLAAEAAEDLRLWLQQDVH